MQLGRDKRGVQQTTVRAQNKGVASSKQRPCLCRTSEADLKNTKAKCKRRFHE